MDGETYAALALAMLYSTSWTEKYTPEGYSFAWKGFDFDALDILEAKGYIGGNHRNKSLHITPEGKAKAEEILGRLEELGRLDL